MFEFAKNIITSHSEHSLLFTTFLTAVLFAVSGVAVELFLGNGVAAAFLVIYAMLAGTLSALGYALVYAGKYLSRSRRRGRPG